MLVYRRVHNTEIYCTRLHHCSEALIPTSIVPLAHGPTGRSPRRLETAWFVGCNLLMRRRREAEKGGDVPTKMM